jgi:F-type H+-transporting ATPase subunit b
MITRRITALIVPLLLAAHPLLAAEEHGGGGEHASGGLPQFDPSTFASQLFWLAVTFAVLYVFFSKKSLPDIAKVLENREKHIKNDLDTAERLQREAEQAQQHYESLLTNAKAEATKLTTGAVTSLKEQAEKNQQAFREKSAKEIDALEGRLKKAKQDAMKDMNKIAAEIAREAAEKIVGIKADIEQAQNVVQALNKREAA